MDILPEHIPRIKVASQVVVFAIAGCVLWLLGDAQKTFPSSSTANPQVIPEKQEEPEKPAIPVFSKPLTSFSFDSNIPPVIPGVIDTALLANPEKMLEETLGRQLVVRIEEILGVKSPMSQEYRIEKILIDKRNTTCTFELKDGKTLSYNYGKKPALVIDGEIILLTEYPERDILVKKCIDSYLAEHDIFAKHSVT